MNNLSQMNPNQPQPIHVDLSKLKSVLCACGKMFFEPVQTYKVMPALYSPTGKPQLIAMNHLRCIECGNVYSADDVLKESIQVD
jgi:hypothetical protein